MQGSGKDGRILKEDMLRFIDGTKLPISHESLVDASLQKPLAINPVQKPQKVPSTHIQAPKPVKVDAPVGADRTEPIKGFKKAMVKSMTHSLVSPIFTLIILLLSSLSSCCCIRLFLTSVIAMKST